MDVCDRMDFINLQADVQLVKRIRAKDMLTYACIAAKLALY